MKRIGAAVTALAALIPVSVWAAAAPLATVGPVSTGPSVYSGGSLYYQFSMNSTVSGPLVVKATLTATPVKGAAKWKPPVFQTVTQTVVVGNNTVKSQVIPIPSGFIGTAALKFTVTLNKKPVVIKPVALLINPRVSQQVSLLDVGFGNTVVLDASGISTFGMGTPTYKWTQKPNALGNMASGNLSAANVVAPTLTTALSDSVFVNADARTTEVVGLENQQVADSTYVYEVQVSGNSITRNATFTVTCAVQSVQAPGSPGIPLGVTAFCMGDIGANGNNTTTWSLTDKPAGSAASLTHGTDVLAQLKPDVAGNYTFSYSTKDGVTGNFTTGNLTKTAASYIGVGECQGCHGAGNEKGNADLVTPWSKTGHASMAQRGVDGLVSPYYNESCFTCHTLGYNAAASASTNGNFKAVANQLGWTFPTELKAGNYAAMPEKLQTLAKIQCESCHGPGSAHNGTPGTMVPSLDVQVCASCHQDGQHHNRVAQWQNGPHAGTYKTISQAEASGGCVRCHSPNGFTSTAKAIVSAQGNGTATEIAAAQMSVGSVTRNATTEAKFFGTGSLTCQTCHDPHDTFGDDSRHQLRIAGTVVVGDLTAAGNVTITDVGNSVADGNATFANVGNSGTCMICHNSRRLPEQLTKGAQYYTSIRVTNGIGTISGPHESPVAEVFSGIGGTDYNYQMGNSYHTYMAECTSCHMYQLRAPDSKGIVLDKVSIGGNMTDVTASLYNEVRDLVGDHSFNMVNDYVKDGVTQEIQNVAACNQCHDGAVTSLDFKGVTARDYDGDGTISGVQTETQNLLDALRKLLNDTGVTCTTDATTGAYTGFYSAGVSKTDPLKTAQLKAAWNWMLIKRDGSKGVHNTQFTIRLLQTSWTDLSVANGGKTFAAAFPKAFIR